MSILKYDVDAVTWNPQGKLQQIDYAKEAVKQGSICLAIKSKTEAVMVTVKKNPSKLACYQEKLFKISDNIGIGISGMTADARILCKFMRITNGNHQLKFNSNISIDSLVKKVSKIFHDKTYIYGKRPFGLGILAVGYNNENEPKIYELDPAGECIEYQCYSIGAKNQTSKTFMETNLNYFKNASLNNLILFGISAIKAGYRDEKEELSENNLEVAILTKDKGYKILSKDELAHYLQELPNFRPENQMLIE